MTRKEKIMESIKSQNKDEKKKAKYTMIEIGEEYQSEQELRMSV